MSGTSAASRPRATTIRAYPWDIVARIERPPRPVEVHLDPGAEIHRVDDGHADIAKMAVHVTSRNVEASAKRHCEMSEIAAHSNPLLEGFERGSRRARLHIVELDMLMDEIARGPSRTGFCRIDPKPFGSACRSRNIGCPSDRGGMNRVAPRPGLQPRKSSPGQSCHRLRSSHRPKL